MVDSSSRSVAVGAFASAISGLAGAIAVKVWLVPGLPLGGNDVLKRASYVVRHHKCWTWGWLLAALGAILVVNLYRLLAERWILEGGSACRFALCLGTAGLAIDLAGIAIWIVVAPGPGEGGFEIAEHIASALSLFAAKILYAAAGLMLTWAGRRELPGLLSGLALIVWLCGFAVASFTLCACDRPQFYSLALLALTYIAWATLIGFHFRKPVREWPPRSYHPDPRD
ncbi:MAG TPA: hypothetical protein VFW45_01990 [Candidatus Polarisedimenticolia bacterium]|nr:hypothetical protein [Candidatus Polarisedimenticolia bacterium]